MKAILELENDRKLIDLWVLVLRTVCYEFRDLAKLITNHVEKMYGCFVKEAASYVHIACPKWAFKLTAVHLYMSRMSSVFLKQLSQRRVDRSVSPVVSNLKNAFALFRNIQKFSCVSDTDRERFFAKHMFVGFNRSRRYFSVGFVWCTDEDGIAMVEQLLAR